MEHLIETTVVEGHDAVRLRSASAGRRDLRDLPASGTRVAAISILAGCFGAFFRGCGAIARAAQHDRAAEYDRAA